MKHQYTDTLFALVELHSLPVSPNRMCSPNGESIAFANAVYGCKKTAISKSLKMFGQERDGASIVTRIREVR
jgi:hypothetical protein